MPNYKAPDNTIHFLDSAEHEYFLPAGSVQITDAQAEALRPQATLTYADTPLADYLDGLVKGDQAQIAKYIAACLAVKAKYPK